MVKIGRFFLIQLFFSFLYYKFISIDCILQIQQVLIKLLPNNRTKILNYFTQKLIFI